MGPARDPEDWACWPLLLTTEDMNWGFAIIFTGARCVVKGELVKARAAGVNDGAGGVANPEAVDDDGFFGGVLLRTGAGGVYVLVVYICAVCACGTCVLCVLSGDVFCVP